MIYCKQCFNKPMEIKIFLSIHLQAICDAKSLNFRLAASSLFSQCMNEYIVTSELYIWQEAELWLSLQKIYPNLSKLQAFSNSHIPLDFSTWNLQQLTFVTSIRH